MASDQPPQPLTGRIALVTGGGRGLGRSIALALAEVGAAVAVAARSSDEVAAVAEEITSGGGRAAALHLDVADAAAVPAAVDHVAERLGPVDVLVANAGVVWPLGRFLDVDQDEWERSVDINLFGAVRCIRAVLPGMVERGYGRIVALSSGAADAPGMPSASAYSAAKAALDLVVTNLARELDGSGVCLTGVRPGVADTSMQDYMRSLPRDLVGDEFYERFHGLHERGELADPAQAARLVVRLVASERTGAIIDVRSPEGRSLAG